MAEESQDDKTETPSQHRIDEFRKRGEVAYSRELTGVLVLAATFLTLGLSLMYIYETFSHYLEWMYKLDPAQAFTEKSQKTILSTSLIAALKCLAPIFLVTMCVGVFIQVAQIGFLFSPEALEMKFDRVNPISGFGRIFSVRSLVEAIKAFFKFVVITFIVYKLLKDDIFSYNGFLNLELSQSFIYGKGILLKLGFSMLLGLGIIALFDLGYQKYSYFQRLKQTKQEQKQEMKEQEGNPEIKQRIRQIQRAMAQKRMRKEVAAADVIITNPTHLSIAIKYDNEKMVSPMVVAKGADNMALTIREIAKEHNIPIVENVPLARTLYKTVKEGEAVPRTVYKAVAEVLAFVYKLRKKQKALSLS